jgi:purine-nucleoside phosphorylase
MQQRIFPITCDRRTLERSAEHLARRCTETLSVAIIAGSGIAPVFEQDVVERIPYADVPILPQTSVAGHQSEILIVRFSSGTALVFAGRYHIYEGYSPAQIVVPVVLAKKLGVTKIALTNAAGGLRHDLRTGDLLLASGMINMTGRALAQQRPSAITLSNSWRERCTERARQQSIAFAEGTYIAVHGPSYETRAEVRFYRMMGDCIGMSTVHEVQAAIQLGIEPLTISVITNTLSDSPRAQPLHHEEVLDASRRAHHRLRALLDIAITTAREPA